MWHLLRKYDEIAGFNINRFRDAYFEHRTNEHKKKTELYAQNLEMEKDGTEKNKF